MLSSELDILLLDFASNGLSDLIYFERSFQIASLLQEKLHIFAKNSNLHKSIL